MPKHYYLIGEVAKMLGIRKHTLRYWEAEFPKLRPKKNNSGKRNYTLEDIETIKKIKYLLHVQNFSIEGARKKMSSHIPMPENEQIEISTPPREIKTILTSRIEKIQDIISLPPKSLRKFEKKKELKSKLGQLRALLSPKEEKQELNPASNNSSSSINSD